MVTHRFGFPNFYGCPAIRPPILPTGAIFFRKKINVSVARFLLIFRKKLAQFGGPGNGDTLSESRSDGAQRDSQYLYATGDTDPFKKGGL
jgi:hypothetical protein